jgi:hypothetical protein
MGQISSNDIEVTTTPSGVTETLSVVNPAYTGIYQFSAQDMPGVVAANNFLSLFNPLASGVNVVIIGGVVGNYLITGATNARFSLQIARVTTAAGGVLQGAATIAKGVTAYPAAMAEVRLSNPAVTLGPVLTAVPPPVSPNFAFRTVLSVAEAAAPLLLVPGEGVVARTAGGDTDQTWNVQVQWAEMLP